MGEKGIYLTLFLFSAINKAVLLSRFFEAQYFFGEEKWRKAS
jgi:hypothetical protein